VIEQYCFEGMIAGKIMIGDERMKEKSSKRRDWVKNAAIVFLSVLLVLTFFSNTILNYSLPEVAVQYVQSGTITAKVRGTGMIESGDPYNVQIKESRKVESVLVQVGTQVAQGDDLFLLAESESTEVETQQQAVEAAEAAVKSAQQAVDSAMLNFELKLLSQNVPGDVYQAAQTGATASMDQYRNEIIAAEAAVDKWQSEADWYTNKINEVKATISALGVTNPDTTNETNKLNEAQKAYDAKALELTNSQNMANGYQAILDQALLDITEYETTGNIASEDVSGGDAAGRYAEAKRIRDTYPVLIENQKATISTLTDQANKLQADVTTAQNALNAKQGNKGSIDALNLEVINLQKELDIRNVNLSSATKTRDDLIQDISNELSWSFERRSLSELRSAVTDAQDKLTKEQEKLGKLKTDSTGTTITAPIAGTITSINVTAGDDTVAGTPIATMQPEGKGYTMTISVTNQQASRLTVGTKADLVNAWRYNNVDVMLSGIKPDPSDPSQKKQLTFTISGDVVSGQSLSISIGDKSAEYDMLVPNSSVREDNNGKFILIVNSKNTPLGNRYTASRVDVEVVASDDVQSAISGALQGYEYVITTSTKPVEAGQQVRLAEN
jgi:multidrug efflux pump subunit AcrA (membrane-fusion protein)